MRASTCSFSAACSTVSARRSRAARSRAPMPTPPASVAMRVSAGVAIETGEGLRLVRAREVHLQLARVALRRYRILLGTRHAHAEQQQVGGLGVGAEVAIEKGARRAELFVVELQARELE